MQPKLIDNEIEYEQALVRIGEIFDATPGSESFEELRLWALLVETYEAVHHPIEQPDPVVFVRTQIERLGISQNEFARRAGIQNSHLSAVLNGKRNMSNAQATAIAEFLNVDPSLLGFGHQHKAA